MHLKAVFPGKYLQGPGVIRELPVQIKAFGRKAFIIPTRSASHTVLEELKPLLRPETIVETFGGECHEGEIERLIAGVKQARADVVVAIGGGKAIDTAKIVADRTRRPVIVAPTIASTDAPTSGSAVIYDEHGVFQKYDYQRHNPDVVIVDTAVIAKAPVRFLVSGMGDALSTWFEASACQRTLAPNCCGGLSTLAAMALAELCYKTLLEYGVSAKLACEQGVVTPALEHIVEANTLLSGLGFESAGLSAAHSIHDGLTALEATHAFYHGEKVAFGVLTGFQLTGERAGTVEEVYRFCESVGLPITLEDIGVRNPSAADLLAVANRACIKEESIHHEAITVTPDKVVAALMAADAVGRARKARV